MFFIGALSLCCLLAVFGVPVWAQSASATFANGTAVADIRAALASGYPERMRSVGTTSTVLQVELAGPIEAAFRPEVRGDQRGFRVELAAYRVAELLGMDNVPPVVVRSLDRGQLRRRLASTSFDVDRDFVVNAGAVRGAFVYWVPDLESRGLDTPQGIQMWSASRTAAVQPGWLSLSGTVPSESRRLAEDLSQVLMFDCLIANVDRMSGGNLKVSQGRLIVRDHNLSMMARPSRTQQDRLFEGLRRTERISRPFATALRSMTRDSLVATLEDPQLGSLIRENEVEGIWERRSLILSYIAALEEQHGERVFF